MNAKTEQKTAKPEPKAAPASMTLEQAKALGLDPAAYGLKDAK